MRIKSRVALLAPALLAAAPVSAQVQVWSPNPVPNQPIPMQQIPPPNPPQYQPNGAWDPAGPAYYDRSGAPMPMAQQQGYVSASPPYYDQTMAPPNPPFAAGPYANAPQNADRWGGSVGGRWYGGVQAPGGWGAYRRPSRGWTLPSYWLGSGFHIPDYHRYGLSAPRGGLFWVRYYDDAVLVDPYGRVQDWTSGIAWGGGGGWGGGASAGAWSNSQSYSNVTVGGGGRQPACAAPCGYGGGYGYGAGGYGYGGGYYSAPTVTTIVIQSAPVVTTTTTTVTEEVFEERYATSYAASAPTKRLLRKVVPRKIVKRRCRC